MLSNLHVKNLALIKEEEIDLKNGLNIITGETGAGKSIIIGSINIALGEKASKDFIRKDADFALVELIFNDDRDLIKNKLKENDIELMEDSSVIISRKISRTSSISKINGETVNLKTLREITSLLVDVHGQHEHQSLINKAKHLEILDEFANKSELSSLKADLLKELENNKNLKLELSNLSMDEEERLRNISFYEFEINEIDEANLKEYEDEELEKAFKQLSSAEKTNEIMNEIHLNISGKDNSAKDLISDSLAALGKLSFSDSFIDEAKKTLIDLESIVTDLSYNLRDYISENPYDEEKLYNIGKRLDTINHLKSKYGNDIKKILSYRDEKEKLLNSLKNNEEEKAKLEAEIIKSDKLLNDIASKISDIRKEYSKKLEVLIIENLKELNFLDVRFNISLKRLDNINNKGFDDVEFMISTNIGEEVMPLGKVASGGELSRVMLAIKTVLAKVDDVSTLIFDEIDTGISGKTAWMVAEKLNIISKNHQVICISHLPQIASMADNHYLIEKCVEDDSTKTSIKILDKDGEINELARILAGDEITDAVLDNAKELKKQAKSKK